MTNYWKPMLAAKPDPAELDAAIAALKYPVLASPKLDGIRAMVQGGRLLSRSLKPIPNLALQKLWGKKELEGLDGEIIAGSPFGEGVFDRTRRVVMARAASAEDAVYHVFDSFTETTPFDDRYFYDVCNRLKRVGGERLRTVPVEQVLIKNQKALLAYEQKYLQKGYEGICVRDPSGAYKQGRSTLKEGGLVAIKRFVDAEAVVLFAYEQQENTNEKTMDALGHSKRSAHKAGKMGKDTLGGFTVTMTMVQEPCAISTRKIVLQNLLKDPRALKFNIGTGVGLTDAVRKELWAKRKSLPGKIVKFRYQKIGTMEAPRLPIWLGFRDGRDI
jgi:DNA ligase-1